MKRICIMSRKTGKKKMAWKNVLKVGMYNIPYLSIWIRICNEIVVYLTQ